MPNRSARHTNSLHRSAFGKAPASFPERNVARSLEETLFLPGVVIAQMVAVIGKKANQGIVGVAASLDGIENPSNAIVDVRDFRIVAGFQHAGWNC